MFNLGSYGTALLQFQKQSSRPGNGSERDKLDDPNDAIASAQGNKENLGKGMHRDSEPGNPLLILPHALIVLLSIKQMYFRWCRSVLPQEVIRASSGILFLSLLDFIVRCAQPSSVWGRI